jgi:hypothetical protein
MSSASASPSRRSPAPRPVVDANGVVHRSIVDAAIAQGVSISAIWQRAALQRHGWRFADEAPRQPAAPSAPSEG